MGALGLRGPGRGALGPFGAGHALEPTGLAAPLLAFAVVCIATWALLHGAGEASAGAAGEANAGAPYRSARQLIVRPWIPLPAGSFQAYVAAVSLLLVPAVLANLHLPVGGLLRALQGDAFAPALVLSTLLFMTLFARLMNRPREMADLALRLGASNSAEIAEATRTALRRALAVTGFFFVTLVVVSKALPLGVSGSVILVAVLLDLAHASRLAMHGDDLVPVWEERRAAAVPVLRAALAAQGVESETRGMAFLSLFQVFVPYAPAQLLVRSADAERARATLRHLMMGDEAPEPVPALPTAKPVARPWSFGRRVMIVGGCLAGAGLALGLLRLPARDEGPPVPRAKLEVVRVDDTLDALRSVPESALPEGEGIQIYRENAPVGPGRFIEVNYARIVMRPGESKKSAAARFRRFVDTVPLPAGARFAFEPVEDVDPDTGKATVVGLRSFLLIGEPVLRTEDVTDADVSSQDMGLGPQAYVAVTLSDDAAKRFEDVTREWTQRRLAILLDDEINSAPVIKTTIAGGHISITMGVGEAPPESGGANVAQKQLEEARHLARGLRRR
jgi:hypothetical protein